MNFAALGGCQTDRSVASLSATAIQSVWQSVIEADAESRQHQLRQIVACGDLLPEWRKQDVTVHTAPRRHGYCLDARCIAELDKVWREIAAEAWDLSDANFANRGEQKMTVELEQRGDGKILVVRVTGRLDKQDYERFTPEVERLIKQHGKIRVLLETHDFHGWEAGALWEDIKFDVKHFNDIERLAVVGEKKWEKGMATFCKPFTTAKVCFFEHDQQAEAEAWIEGES